MKNIRNTFEYDDVYPIFVSFMDGKSVSKIVLSLIAGEITLEKKKSMHGNGGFVYVRVRAYNSYYLLEFTAEVADVVDSAILGAEMMLDGPVDRSTSDDDTVVFYWFTK